MLNNILLPKQSSSERSELHRIPDCRCLLRDRDIPETLWVCSGELREVRGLFRLHQGWP